MAVDVLPETHEARLTYLAARRWTAFSVRRLLVVDIGGGSLEVAAKELGTSLHWMTARPTRATTSAGGQRV